MRGAGGLGGADGGGGGSGGPPSGPAGGIDIAGTYPNAVTVVGLRSVAIAATAPVLGNVLTYNGSQWAPAAPSSGLPSQAGNANKVLITNGTTPSWTATLVDLALTGVAAAVEIQSALDVNITALGGLVGTFGDVVSITTSNGTLELGSTDTATIQSVSADVHVLANSGITLQTTTGIVSVPTRAADDDGNAAASTGHVKLYVPTPGSTGQVLRSTGTAWTSDQLAVADVSGAAPLASPALTGNPTAPTPALGDNDTSISTTAFVQASRDPARVLELIEDFEPGATTVYGTMNWIGSVNGAANSIAPNPVLLDAWGTVQLNAGTSSGTGRAALSFEQVAGRLPWYQPWASASSIFEWRFRLGSALPVVTLSDYEIWLGIGQGAATAGITASNGIGLGLSGASPNFRLLSRTAGVDIANVDTGVPATTGAWWYARIEVDAVGARLYLGATKTAAVLVATTLVGTLTATAQIGPLIKIRNIAGTLTGGRLLQADYFHSRIVLTASR